MNKKLSLLISLFVVLLSPSNMQAQRQHIALGRGVVATYNPSTGVTVTWRRLIADPEDALYHLYVAKPGSTDYTRLTSSPIRLTNYTATLARIPDGASLYVTLVDAAGQESDPSLPFTFRRIQVDGTSINNAYLSINYRQAGSPIYNHDGLTFVTKFCWPVDLDGDGEMEYVVNRIYSAKDQNGYEGWGEDALGGDCLEAYDRQGQHLWTVGLGVNFFAFGGQNDGVTVGDFDGDGRGEVMVQVAEGARFWDPERKDFGLYLHYNGQQASATGSGMVTVSSDGLNPDIDQDGMTNYTWRSKGKNAQWYMAVIDGLTGRQKDVCAMTLPKDKDMSYTRTNKASFMSDEYSYLSPAMGTAYLDGIHQSAVAQFQCRTLDGTHHYFTYAYGYREGELKEEWIFRFHDYQNLSEFHHIRIGDVDGDGCDEVMNGQMAVDHDGQLLWSSGISHGDRFRLSDIDPDHPGLEIFAIQQNAPDMLGQILYSATDGTSLHRWYMSAVGDVGRGECMDVDPDHRGYEMWSTLPNLYSAQGECIATEKPYPYEGIWWDGDLGRESLITSGSNNNCPAIVAKYDKSGSWTRLNEISKGSSWHLVAENAVRPMFWGDIAGDWREELVLKQLVGGEECGLVALTTNYATSVNNIYCLLQDPNYFGQITNRGYYQSPNTGFYLGYDMPRPSLPPFVRPDSLHQVFDLTLGDATIQPSARATHLYALPVKGQTLTLSGQGGEVELWKSQPGTLCLEGAHTSSGRIVVSEGTLRLKGSIAGTVDLRARGTLAGEGTVGQLLFEGALNSEGCRLQPESVLTITGGLSVDHPLFVSLDLLQGCCLRVQGDFNVSALTTFLLSAEGLQPGEYTLVEFTGAFAGKESLLAVDGLTGLSYNLRLQEHALLLVVNAQREASDAVCWTGAVDGMMDYQTENFTLSDAATTFVAGDGVTFDDRATRTTVTLSELLPIGSATFRNDEKSYTVEGDGGFSGTGGLTFSGQGTVNLFATHSDYTGPTLLQRGIVRVKTLADAGTASSLGAASADASLLQIGGATLWIDNVNTSTNRGMTLLDTATVRIPSGTASFKGIIKGTGLLRKSGAGQLNITYAGSNTWAGTILEAGTLAMGTWNTTFGRVGSPIHVTGNATLTIFSNDATSQVPSLQNAITIDEGKTLTLHMGKRCTFKGSLAGKGTCRIDFPYVRGDVYTDMSKFEGTFHVTTTNGRFAQAIDLSHGTLQLDASASVTGVQGGGSKEVSYNHKVGTLSGSGTLGTGIWQISRLVVSYYTNGKTISYSSPSINGTARLTNLVIELSTSSTAALPDSTQLQVLKGSGTRVVTGTVTVIPAQPKEGWLWDTSRLASEGLLQMVPDVTGIREVQCGTDAATVYDLLGRPVSHPSSGLYVKGGRKSILAR